jgi:hypothetical protein
MCAAEKQNFPDNFRSPRRRTTRQRSGHNVSGQGTGSTCKIEQSIFLKPTNGIIEITAKLNQATVPALFLRKIGIFGAGIYVRPEASCKCAGQLSWQIDGKETSYDFSPQQFDASGWQRAGGLIEIAIPDRPIVLKNLSLKISLETSGPVSVYGAIIDALTYEPMMEEDIYEAFNTKTSLYIPEILYLDPTEDALQIGVTTGKAAGTGRPIVCKSCNRCSRFLPIDVENDRNTLSYSNHCVSRAPCSHSAFSTYRVVSGSTAGIEKFVVDGHVTSRHGHQLECKPCKKFVVNLPLNPLRNSTQHREDGLRRRALEILIGDLLGSDWIYHEHRLATGKEFDVHIWDKFGRKCFKCQVDLETPNAMHLDHTLPLAYLWPLDNTATCLCPTCNSSKHDRFPIDFYNEEELSRLAKITGIALATLKTKPINQDAVKKLFQRIVWFFDEFLAEHDYQKIRENKKAADLIVHALHNVLRHSGYNDDLVKLYRSQTGKNPSTVSVR